MKTAAQTERAMAEREANARARAANRPLPFPNVWDALLPKLTEGATEAEISGWHREFAERHAPERR